MARDSGGEGNGEGGGGGVAAFAERLARGDVEQQVSVELDHARRLVVFSIMERFSIKPTVVGVPFHMIDFVQWQRLTHELQAAGVLNLQAAPRPQ